MGKHLKQFVKTDKDVVYDMGQGCLTNPRIVKTSKGAMIGLDVETDGLCADGYSDLCRAIHELKRHPEAGILALDVLSHLPTAFSQDSHAMGAILNRVHTTLTDADNKDAGEITDARELMRECLRVLIAEDVCAPLERRIRTFLGV